jgi:hypothetical protein
LFSNNTYSGGRFKQTLPAGWNQPPWIRQLLCLSNIVVINPITDMLYSISVNPNNSKKESKFNSV